MKPALKPAFVNSPRPTKEAFMKVVRELKYEGTHKYRATVPFYRHGELYPADTIIQVTDEVPSVTWQPVPDDTPGAIPLIHPFAEDASGTGVRLDTMSDAQRSVWQLAQKTFEAQKAANAALPAAVSGPEDDVKVVKGATMEQQTRAADKRV